MRRGSRTPSLQSCVYAVKGERSIGIVCYAAGMRITWGLLFLFTATAFGQSTYGPGYAWVRGPDARRQPYENPARDPFGAPVWHAQWRVVFQGEGDCGPEKCPACGRKRVFTVMFDEEG